MTRTKQTARKSTGGKGWLTRAPRKSVPVTPRKSVLVTARESAPVTARKSVAATARKSVPVTTNMTTSTDTGTSGTDTVAKRIGDFLFHLESPGEFGVQGAADELPALPGMQVEGINGVLPLPVNDDAAEKLKSIARIAPFGKGFDTVVDETVRKAWEIDADKLSFANPSWKEAVQKLTNRVARELGCDKSAIVEPILYKALLYETGGHFKAHKDTEKEDNMFATLVIQLPSVCTGGTLSMRHGEESTTAGFGQSNGEAPYKAHYAAFYADVEHSLQPVTSGYRLSLTYSLCWKSPAITLPNLSNLPIDRILPCMRSWSNDKPIAILLEHEYTESYFSEGMNTLKGRDLEVIKSLKSCNKHLSADCKLRIVLANISCQVNEYGCGGGYYSSCEWEKEGSSFDVAEVFDIEGSSTQRAFDFHSLQIIDMKSGELIDEGDEEWWGEAVEEEEESYTGNAGPTRETLYKKHVIVIYPMKFEFSRILKVSGLKKGAEYLLSAVDGSECVSTEDQKTDPQYQLRCSQWDTLYKRMFSSQNTHNFTSYYNTSNSTILNAMLKITMRLARLDFAGRLLRKTEKNMKATSVFKPSLNCMLDLVQKFGWKSLCRRLRKLIPLLVECYSVAECLLKAELIPKNDPLVETLCVTWPSGLLEGECVKSVWSFYSALGCNTLNQQVATKLCDNVALQPYGFQLLRHLITKPGDQSQTAQVQILFDAFLNDRNSLLYDEKQQTTPGCRSPMLFLAWHYFEKMDDKARQRSLARMLVNVLSLNRLRNFINLCIGSKSVENESNLGIVLVHWLQAFKQQDKPVFTWSLPYDVPGHPTVQAFMRNPKEQNMKYHNFDGIQHARNWASKHFGYSNTKSASASASGVGKNAHVVVWKKKDYFNSLLETYSSDSELFTSWNSRLVTPISLPVKRSLSSSTSSASKRGKPEIIEID